MRTYWEKIIFDNPKRLLDQFSEYVEEKRLEKVPYHLWRDLVRWIQGADKYNAQVGLQYNNKQELEVYWSSRDVADYTLKRVFTHKEFHAEDKSFGTFIYTFLEDEDTPWQESDPLYYSNSEFSTIPLQPWDGIASLNDGSIAAATKAFKDMTNAIKKSATLPRKSSMDEAFKTINEKLDKERENKTMKFNFDFGTCEKDNIRMSPYGLAIKNADGAWVSYDVKSGNIVDVDIFNFDGGKYFFKMPVAVKDVKVGDVIVHNHTAVYVVSVDGGDIVIVDPRMGDKRTILPVTNMFGFNFITKVVNLFDGAMGTPSTDNPFGNMLPFFLMSNSGSDIDPLVMAMLLNGGNAAGTFSNPMMLALLCGDQTNMRDVLPLMMLAGQNGNPFNQPAAK